MPTNSILPWHSCECGCKGSTIRLGLNEFIVRGYRPGELELSTGHVVGHRIGTVASLAEAETKILETPAVMREIDHMRELLKKIDERTPA